MIAARDPGSVVLAQAHTPFDPSVGEPAPLTFGDPFVTLGPLPNGDYDIEFACSGGRGGDNHCGERSFSGGGLLLYSRAGHRGVFFP